MTEIFDCDDSMNVLVACEFSGIVREAFLEEGFNAISCDLRETERKGPHIQGEALTAARIYDWDMVIAHPNCQFLTNSGVRWLHEREGREINMEVAAHFFKQFLELDVPYIAVENPVMHNYGKKIIGRGQDFTCQPWEFGDPEKKAVCWWTKNLPELEPTDIVPEEEREARVHKMPPGEERSKERSRFFEGMAEAMAEQWGGHIRKGSVQSFSSASQPTASGGGRS